MTDQVIKHYGKRGMKWGVRSSPKTSGGKSEGKKPNPKLEKAKQIGKASLPVAKNVAVIGLKTGLIAGLAAIGVPAAIAGASIMSITNHMANNPEIQALANKHTNKTLQDHGDDPISSIE